LKIKFDTLTVTLLGLNMFGKNLKKLVPTHYDDYKVYVICHIHSKIWNGTTMQTRSLQNFLKINYNNVPTKKTRRRQHQQKIKL
jgi:hypothetical protein